VSLPVGWGCFLAFFHCFFVPNFVNSNPSVDAFVDLVFGRA
jgi:hypothetical protein